MKEELDQEHVLNSSDGSYNKELKAVIKELKPKVLFECVGGNYGAHIFARMPYMSTMHVTGSITYKDLDINVGDLIISEKTIKGFYL